MEEVGFKGILFGLLLVEDQHTTEERVRDWELGSNPRLPLRAFVMWGR